MLVWGVEAFMWPWTYIGWPKFNKVYTLLWTYLGQWTGLGIIALNFTMFAVCLSKAEIASSGSSWIHSGKNNTTDTDTVLKDDVRYALAMYLAVESMYLMSWFMYGKDALDYYIPESERGYEYEIAPLEDQQMIEDMD